MTSPRLRDERLAWLAVRDELDRRSRRSVFGILTGVLGARGLRTASQFARQQRNEQLSGRMMRYSIVVDELARQLGPEEREMLRHTGAVPPWFLPKVLAEAPKVRLH